MHFCGTAFTVVCHPRDNIMLQVAISYAQPDDVLVVSSGDQPAGQFGDVLANACAARGIAALVTDGGVRDTREIRELGFPVFAQFICIQGTVKESLGPVNQPLVLGGQLIRPGDVVKGDCDGVVVDGVVVIAREDGAEVVDACRAREEAEAGYIRRYRDGETPSPSPASPRCCAPTASRWTCRDRRPPRRCRPVPDGIAAHLATLEPRLDLRSESELPPRCAIPPTSRATPRSAAARRPGAVREAAR